MGEPSFWLKVRDYIVEIKAKYRCWRGWHTFIDSYCCWCGKEFIKD